MKRKETHKLSLELSHRLIPSLEMRLLLLEAPLISLEQIILENLEANPALEIEEEREEKTEEDTVLQILKDYCPYFTNEEEEKEETEGKEDRSYIINILTIKAAKRFKGENYRVAKAVIENLDEKGILQLPFKELCERYKFDKESAKRVWNEIKRIGPLGVGSSSPQEVLLLKLEEAGFAKESVEYKIVQDYFEDFVKHNISYIKDKLRVSKEEIMVAIKRITRFSPYPFIKRERKGSPVIVPDILIKWKEGRYIVVSNKWNIPTLKVSSHLREILMNKDKYDKEAVRFAKKSIYNAEILLKAIREREKTLLKIGEIIAESERPFFENYQNFPVIIDIEDTVSKLGISSSTFYRAIREKYIDTPKGLFPMSIFFSKKKNINNIEDTIREIINSEDPLNPYSDEMIAEKLKEMGISLSRRTVTKYRKKLNIPDKNKRIYFKGS